MVHPVPGRPESAPEQSGHAGPVRGGRRAEELPARPEGATVPVRGLRQLPQLLPHRRGRPARRLHPRLRLETPARNPARHELPLLLPLQVSRLPVHVRNSFPLPLDYTRDVETLKWHSFVHVPYLVSLL